MKSRSCFPTLACECVLAMAVALAVAPAQARACDIAATARPDSTCVVLARDGVRGVWFDLATAEELRTSQRLIPELRLQLEKYSGMDTSQAAEVAALRDALAARQAVVDALKVEAQRAAQMARAAEAEAIAAREDADRWWRSPIVWLTVGALAGALAGIAIVN